MFDYRGEVGVVLFNHADDDFRIRQGDLDFPTDPMTGSKRFELGRFFDSLIVS